MPIAKLKVGRSDGLVNRLPKEAESTPLSIARMRALPDDESSLIDETETHSRTAQILS